MRYAELARGIESALHLESPPVALAFVHDPPDDVATSGAEVPSACTFWRHAEREVLYAPDSAHFNCPVGAMVMGFDLPANLQEELQGLVGEMCGCNYLGSDEAAAIPSVKGPHRGIVYGPLAEFPLEPDVVLMWLAPHQAMLFGEASGISRWSPGSPPAAYGRPACAALPVALEGRCATLSLGCMGMRTFTEVGGDRLLAVVPGDQIAAFLERLNVTVGANAAMQRFYEGQKAKFA